MQENYLKNAIHFWTTLFGHSGSRKICLKTSHYKKVKKNIGQNYSQLKIFNVTGMVHDKVRKLEEAEVENIPRRR